MTGLQQGQQTRRRLRIAQQAFQSAENLAKTGISDADRVAAVVQLDFAAETTLRTYLFDRRHQKARTQKFPELLDTTSTELEAVGLTTGLPNRGGLEQLRSVRNAAQHDARVPTTTEVTECLVHTRVALVELCRFAWDTDFFAADVDAVASQQVVVYLRRAAEAHSSDDNDSAMGWLRAAFEYAFRHGGENVVGKGIFADEIVVRKRGTYRGQNAFEGSHEAATALRRLQVLGRLTAFGMNVREYLAWRGKFADAPALNIQNELVPRSKPVSWTDEDYAAALLYVVESVLKMEQIVPDVDPGGFERGGYDKL